MKTTIVFALLCAGLLLAASAHAFAVYNHVDHEVCLNDRRLLGCKYKIKTHSTLNGEHGAGFKHAFVNTNDKTICHAAVNEFDIPKGGYARICKHEVKVYKHSGKHIKTIEIESSACGQIY